jgi:hypothetical protein
MSGNALMDMIYRFNAMQGGGVSKNGMGDMLRPFDRTLDRPRRNQDGSESTELTRTVPTLDGWANIPSLWFGDGGSTDLGQFSDDELAELAILYEQRYGKRFPRFSDMEQAEMSASKRSEAGGAK